MTPQERTQLSQEAFKDPKFRAAMLRDPQAAAASLGIRMTDAERDSMLAVAGEIRAHGHRIDEVLARKGAENWRQVWDSGELDTVADGVWAPIFFAPDTQAAKKGPRPDAQSKPATSNPPPA